MIFEEKKNFIEHKMCVLIFSTTFVWNLGWLVVEHNCVNIGVFIDFVEQQLHVSAHK